MGLTQTKLHWHVLAQDWSAVRRRITRRPEEASTVNPYGDLPLHLCCYGGQAPPHIIRALIDSYPESIRQENKAGRDPLELASINYRVEGTHRSAVLALLRWHRPGSSPSFSENDDLFSNEPPDQMYSTSPQCVVCLEKQATIALLPCGHICLCTTCVSTTMRRGLCPVDRCEVEGLYKVPESELCGGGGGGGSQATICSDVNVQGGILFGTPGRRSSSFMALELEAS
eukprot:scaffold825_cov196-Alexandrium_tamarense.AAC.14